MSAPTANHLAAATKPQAEPIVVIQFPDINGGYYVASSPAHYPVSGAGSPFHKATIKQTALPWLTRKLRRAKGLFSGRAVTSVGTMTIVDTGELDTLYGNYASTMRGTKINGFITYPDLDFADAYQYLTGRVVSTRATSGSTLEIRIRDARSDELASKKLTGAAYGPLTLGTIVQTELTNAGLVYPTDYDTTAWNAWTDATPGAEMPGSMSVTGTTNDGGVFEIIDALIKGTNTVYWINRSGKIVFKMIDFVDAAAPADYDIDADVTSKGSTLETSREVFHRVAVKYDNGTPGEAVATSGVASGHAWRDTARDGDAIDTNLNNATDAGRLADLHRDFLTQERALIVIDAKSTMMAYDLTDHIHFTPGNNHLPTIATHDHLVIAITEKFPRAKTTMLTRLGITP